MPSVIIKGHCLKDGVKYDFNWYYPSVIVKEYLRKGRYVNGKEFLKCAMNAIIEANNRVIKKYGFYCSFSKELESLLIELMNHELTNIIITDIN